MTDAGSENGQNATVTALAVLTAGWLDGGSMADESDNGDNDSVEELHGEGYEIDFS